MMAGLSVQAIKARLDAGESLLLVDIREPYELMISHLDGAQAIPMSEIQDRYTEIPRDRPVVIFCHHGVRSVRVIEALQEIGYTNLINMQGGIDAWSKEIDPAVPRY